jgi:uncharacterized protein YbcV (DUF1398 family)
MFSIDQITEAHSKVKSGADFPYYVQDLIKLGVTNYNTYVSDGHTVYFGRDNYQTETKAKYLTLNIEDEGNVERFKHSLKIHQQGKTDYLTFCRHCAETGVEKWAVDMQAMTCTYFDKAENKMAVEEIPRK